MVHGLRIEDAQTLQDILMADQRLLARVGALLQNKFAITQAVLAEWQQMEGLKGLLMDRSLSSIEQPNAADLIAQYCGPQSGLILTSASDTWRVLAFDDEIDNPLLAGLSEGANDPIEPHDELRSALPSSLHPALDALMAAASDAERAAAVEQLRYQKPDLNALRHLIPLFLGDGAEQVREAARRLLTESGAQPSIYRLLAYFADPDERNFNTLRQEIGAVDQAHAEICIAILRAALDQQARIQDILSIATCIPEQLARSDQLPSLLGALMHHGNALSLLGLVRGMQKQTETTAVETYLRSLLGASREMDARLIALLSPPQSRMSTELVERAIDLLLGLDAEPLDRMPIATALLQAANHKDIIPDLITSCQGRHKPLESASLWLLGEWARDQLISPEHGTELQDLLLLTCEQGDGPQINTLLEQRIPANLYQGTTQAGPFITALGELASRTRASRNLDLIQSQISDLSLGHAEECWQLIEEHPHISSRKMALHALPRALTDQPVDVCIESIQRLLQVLHLRKSARSNELREEAALTASTAARISLFIGPDMPSDLVASFDQAATELGPHGWQALGIFAASHHCNPSRRSALIDIFLRNCLGEISDSGSKEVNESGNSTFIFDQSLSAHTHFVPDLLIALEALCRSSQTPKPLLRHIIDRLSDHFLAVSQWEVVWAPGNIGHLAKLLTGLAKEPLFPPNLRRRVVEALSTRLTQPDMAKMMGEVLAADLDGELAAQAAQSLQQIIRYHADNHYLDDERGELCSALMAYLRIGDFGDNDEILRNRLATTLSSLKRHFNKAQRKTLAHILADCNDTIRQRLRWAID